MFRFKNIYKYVYTKLHILRFSRFGKNSSLSSPIRLVNPDKISIGENVYIGEHSWLESLPQSTGKITIGSNTSITGFCTITSQNSVTIESEVLIARYCYISDHSHKFSDPSRPIKRQGTNKISAVTIKRGAWLGQGVVICPGVTIGTNSVIGANSVVTKSIPDYCVAAGSPARVLRKIK